jgi:hypothetical protein
MVSFAAFLNATAIVPIGKRKCFAAGAQRFVRGLHSRPKVFFVDATRPGIIEGKP